VRWITWRVLSAWPNAKEVAKAAAVRAKSAAIALKEGEELAVELEVGPDIYCSPHPTHFKGRDYERGGREGGRR